MSCYFSLIVNFEKSYIFHGLLCTCNSVGTCITYLTAFDTIKNTGIGSIPMQIPELVQPHINAVILPAPHSNIIIYGGMSLLLYCSDQCSDKIQANMDEKRFIHN